MVLVLFAWSGEIMVMRSYPMYMEYMAIRGTLSSLAVNAERTGVNSREIRRQFDVEAREKGIQALRGVDLEISSGDGSVSIGIEYSRIVPVAGNVGLQFDFVVRSQG